MKLKTLKTIYFVYLPNVLIALGLAFFLAPFSAVIKDELWYVLKSATGKQYLLGAPSSDLGDATVFGRYLSQKPIYLKPVNTDFALVIEKIDLNVPIVSDVSITDEDSYKEALTRGIAHASISQYPSRDIGNVYLFAHATVNFWELGKYASVFNLLRKLELGDNVHVFYKGQDFVYKVVNKQVMDGWNTYPITRPVLDSTLTLQTCDPPGTTLNRLIVTAILKEVRE